MNEKQMEMRKNKSKNEFKEFLHKQNSSLNRENTKDVSHIPEKGGNPNELLHHQD